MTREELEAANANARAEALRGALSHRGRRYPPLDRPDSNTGTHPDAHKPCRASETNQPAVTSSHRGGGLPTSKESH